MDSVREEVRSLVFEAITTWGRERLSDREKGADETTDAIMSALKRGAGVVVRELEWKLVQSHPAYENVGLCAGSEYEAVTPFGKYTIHTFEDRDNAAFFNHKIIDAGTRLLDLEAAKAACQAHLVGVITSAVEPSCVVSGIPRELLSNCIAVLNEFGSSGIPEWDEAPDTAVTIRPAAQRRGLPELRDMTLGVGDFVAARHYAAALSAAAALSSRTEEDIRADEVNEAIAALVASARKCDTTWKSGNPLGRWKGLREALDRYDRAAIANPPRGERSVIEAAIHKLALEADRSELTIDRGQDAIGRPVRPKLSDWLRSPARSLTNGEG